MIKLFTISIFGLLLTACISTPAALYEKKANQLGLKKSIINTERFDLSTFTNSAQSSKDSELHIYLEGDGQPFIRERYINLDPTSLKGVALKLIAKDPKPSVLLGRPCYHQTSIRNCEDSKWWTSHRYSQEVVDALVGAISQLNQQGAPVIIIGHSGGGALAMLIGASIKNLRAIVTISGNLDIIAWTQQHAYTPLFGSLNPVDYLAPLSVVQQLHLVGAKDNNIPYTRWAKRVSTPETSRVKIIPEFNHTCCWPTIWPTVLEELN